MPDWEKIAQRKNDNILLNMAINHIADTTTNLTNDYRVKEFADNVRKRYRLYKAIHKKVFG